MLPASETESLEVISFRGSTEDKALMIELAERLNCKPSAIPRIALRVIRDLFMSTMLSEAMHRVHVYNVNIGRLLQEKRNTPVIQTDENVLRKRR